MIEGKKERAAAPAVLFFSHAAQLWILLFCLPSLFLSNLGNKREEKRGKKSKRKGEQEERRARESSSEHLKSKETGEKGVRVEGRKVKRGKSDQS